MRALRPRADEAHVAADHRHELRQFVQAGLADELADARAAIVVLARPHRHAILLRVHPHAAELGEGEVAPALAHPRLAVEDRSARFHPDRQCDQQHQRPRDQQQRQRRGEIEEALAQPARRRVIEAAGEHQPRRIDHVELDHAGLALEEARQIHHRHAALHAQQHLFHRQTAAAFVRGDHQFVDLQALDEVGQSFLARAHQQFLLHHHRLAGHRHETDHQERATVGLAAHARVDQVGVLACAEDQYPLLEHVRTVDVHPGEPDQADADQAQRQRYRLHATTDVGRGHQVVQHHQADAAESER